MSVGAGASAGLAAKDGCSGHAPLSSEAKSVPAPAVAWPPNAFQIVGDPMNSLLESVSIGRGVSACTATTPGIESTVSTEFAGMVARHRRTRAAGFD